MVMTESTDRTTFSNIFILVVLLLFSVYNWKQPKAILLFRKLLSVALWCLMLKYNIWQTNLRGCLNTGRHNSLKWKKIIMELVFLGHTCTYLVFSKFMCKIENKVQWDRKSKSHVPYLTHRDYNDFLFVCFPFLVCLHYFENYNA